jgi:hypothetical protein
MLDTLLNTRRYLLPPMLALLCPGALTAQLPSVPIGSSPLHNYRYAAHADAVLSRGDLGRQWALGARAAVERDSFHFEAMVATVHARDDQHDAATAVGLQVARVLTHRYSPTIDIDLESGVGYARFTLPGGNRHSQLDIPLGVGISLRAPLPVAGTPEIWLAPRAQLRRSSLSSSGGTSHLTRVGGGFGFGLNFVFFSGLEAQLGAEWLWIQSETTRRTRSEPGVRLSGGYRWQ